MEQIYYFSNSKLVDVSQPIVSQCRDGDTLQICKSYNYNVIWNGQRYSFPFYTNVPYSLFVNAFFHHLGIADNKGSTYDLYCGSQLIGNWFQFPFKGLSDDLYVEQKRGIIHF